MTERSPRIAYLCFFLSGLSSLIYEIAWLNRIQLVMGHTIFSMTTTLSAYMIGLALGSLWVPRIRRAGIDSLNLYLGAELLIGFYGLIFHHLLKLSQFPYDHLVIAFSPSFLTLNLIQFLFCGSLVLLPTVLMGTTLPLLADYLYSKSNNISTHSPLLYATNALGASTGTLLAGFILLPGLGYSGTIQWAAGTNFLLFILASLWMDARPIFVPSLNRDRKDKKDKFEFKADDRWIFGILLVSGSICTLIQVIWNRLAALGFGPSCYIFPLVTSHVLLGIAIGSLISYRVGKTSIGNLVRFVHCLPAAAATMLLLGNYLLSQSPRLILALQESLQPGFRLLTLLEFMWLGFCILPGSILTGALFPAATSALTSGRSSSAALHALSVGYALNILGLILGALLGTFLLLPYFGIEGMAQLTYVLLFMTSVALCFRQKRALLPAIAFGLIGWILFNTVPRFNWRLLTSGYFYNRVQQMSDSELASRGWTEPATYVQVWASQLVDHHDDPHATISIHTSRKNPSYWAFKINGKVDGSTGEDMRTTRLLAALPALVQPNAKTALIIGLGTGSTAAVSLQYPRMEKTKVIELSPTIVLYGKKYFSGIDGNIWKDPRFSVENRDGRDYLEHTRDKYDIIISEPSNPWVDGVGNLFTEEYFDTVSRKLNPGGVASVWFHSYSLDCPSVYSVLSAAAHAFGSLTVFKIRSDLFMLGTNETQPLTLQPLPSQLGEIEKILFKEAEIYSYQDKVDAYQQILKTTFLYDREMILKMDFFTEVNQDDNQLLQYRAGKTFSQKIQCLDFPDSGLQESSHVYLSQHNSVVH